MIIYLFGFYVASSTAQVISRRVVGRAEETSIYSWSRFCTVNCRPTASNSQLSWGQVGIQTLISEVGCECVTTPPPCPLPPKKACSRRLIPSTRQWVRRLTGAGVHNGMHWSVMIILYCIVFILCTISPCGLKSQCGPSDYTSTAQLSSYWRSPNWKTEAQGWPFINVLEVQISFSHRAWAGYKQELMWPEMTQNRWHFELGCYYSKITVVLHLTNLPLLPFHDYFHQKKLFVSDLISFYQGKEDFFFFRFKK